MLDIVSIQEVKMNKEQANVFLSFDGFSTYYKPRKNNPEYWERVAIIIIDTIYHIIIPELSGVNTIRAERAMRYQLNISYFTNGQKLLFFLFS